MVTVSRLPDRLVMLPRRSLACAPERPGAGLRVIALPLVIALVAGCLLGAQAQATAPTMPKGVDLKNPLALADAVRVALLNSPSLNIATQQSREAEASAVQARAQELPNVSASWNWQKAQSQGMTTYSGTGVVGQGSVVYTSRTLQVGVSQTFYQSGLRDQVRAAEFLAEAARQGIGDSRRQLVLSVAEAYYTAQTARALVDVARRAVMASRQHLDMANARIAAEVAPASDRYTFEVELAQAQVAAINAEKDMDVAFTELKITMGLPANFPLQLTGDMERPPLPTDVTALTQKAYQVRPDVRQAEAQVEAARRSLRVAQAARGPVVNAGATAGYGDYDELTGGIWSLQIGVSYPIFDAGSTRAGEDKARAALKSAQDTLQAVLLNVSRQIGENLDTAVKADAAIGAAEVALTAARIALEAAQGRYEVQLATTVDVTDAELKLRQAEQDRVQALFTYNTALAALRASLGQSAVAGIE